MTTGLVCSNLFLVTEANKEGTMTDEQAFDYLADLFYREDNQEHRELVRKIQNLLIQATGFED